MVKIKITLFFTILIIFFVVSKCNKSTSGRNAIEEIDVEGKIGRYDIIKLSQFGSTIKYIPLKLDNRYPITRIVKIDFCGGKVLISDGKTCQLLNKDGIFISKIGSEGRGPGEYDIISNIGFGTDNSIFIQPSDGRFLEFSYDGTLIGISIVPSNYSPDYFIGSWIKVNDSLFFGQPP